MSEPRPRLVLIDGHAVAHRQFHASQGRLLTTKDGEPTQATYGFSRTLLDIILAKEPPKYLAVVFDEGLSGRETHYVEYKTNRVEMDQALVVQLTRIREMVTAFNIPILALEGYEADDVIGTIAKQAVNQGVHVHVVTGDQDLFQLIDENTTIELPARDGQNVTYDAAGVKAKLGINPIQIPDYKGLVGDNSDNIPGVKGIGEKGAVTLLEQFPTLEGVYEHLDQVPAKFRAKLENGRESAFLSKQLATIMRDLPIRLELEKCITHEFDRAKVLELLKALEFKSLIQRLAKHDSAFRALFSLDEPTKAEAQPHSSQPALFDMPTSTSATDAVAKTLEDDPNLQPATAVIHFEVINTHSALDALLAVLSGASYIAFDTETDSIDPYKANLVGISLAVNGDLGYYIPLGHLEGEQLPLEIALAALRPYLEAGAPKVAHNAPYDLIVLAQHGIHVDPLGYDTMIAESLIQETTKYSLKQAARSRFKIAMTTIDTLIGKGKDQITMDRVAIDAAAPYAAADAAITYKLMDVTRAELIQQGMWRLFDEIEMPVVPVIADLNRIGARLDLPYLADLSKEFEQRLNALETEIQEMAGEPFKVSSLKQLNYILFEKLALNAKGLRKTQHGYSIDAGALELLQDQHPIIRRISDWRALEKLRSTYVDALQTQVDAEGRVHTSYNQIGSVTGRLSSESPNLQNIPIRTEEGRRVRKAFIAADGCFLLSADYSQIELRILAHYSGDEALKQAFWDDQDIHKATAALVNAIPLDQVTKEQRYFAKRVNFGLMYGMGAQRLARESELSRAEAEQFIKNYFDRLPGITRYLNETKELARNQGYLETQFGRRRNFKALQNPLTPRQDVARMEREAINMPIQGTAADIMKIAMRRVWDKLREGGYKARMILQVHDELVLEVPRDELTRVTPLLRETMQSAAEISVPLKVEANIGQNWAEMTAADLWFSQQHA